ncbi:MAG: hypothetical protein VX644_11845 [Planctomycetota bacterium]|nr:hypothetical protein [Planctomycetota bacterium]
MINGSPCYQLLKAGRQATARTLLACGVLATTVVVVGGQQVQERKPSRPPVARSASEPARAKADPYKMRHLRGRVVWLHEVLKRRYGIGTVPEAAQRILALETPQGQLFPIVEDIRGRAFRKDSRLRQLDCELLVRQLKDSSLIQIIRVYAHEKGKKVEVDYWCEICAIAMYELKPCDCCQGAIDLRKRPVADSQP